MLNSYCHYDYYFTEYMNFPERKQGKVPLGSKENILERIAFLGPWGSRKPVLINPSFSHTYPKPRDGEKLKRTQNYISAFALLGFRTAFLPIVTIYLLVFKKKVVYYRGKNKQSNSLVLAKNKIKYCRKIRLLWVEFYEGIWSLLW